MHENVIELRDVSKIYPMGGLVVPALSNVSGDIMAGEFVAVMGASGSGKSTLTSIIGCLDRPTSGSVRVCGSDVSRLTADERATLRNRDIGFVFQNFQLMARMSALENVELPLFYGNVSRGERRRRAREALSAVGLHGYEDHGPMQLSGGQQQRVAIARAIVNRPRLLLADEPTGNLDTPNSLEILSLFVRLNDDLGVTVVMVTHDSRVAAFARRVITVGDGRIISDDSDVARATSLAPFAAGAATASAA